MCLIKVWVCTCIFNHEALWQLCLFGLSLLYKDLIALTHVLIWTIFRTCSTEECYSEHSLLLLEGWCNSTWIWSGRGRKTEDGERQRWLWSCSAYTDSFVFIYEGTRDVFVSLFACYLGKPDIFFDKPTPDRDRKPTEVSSTTDAPSPATLVGSHSTAARVELTPSGLERERESGLWWQLRDELDQMTVSNTDGP